MGVVNAIEAADRIFTLIDTDKSGTICLSEWCTATMDPK